MGWGPNIYIWGTFGEIFREIIFTKIFAKLISRKNNWEVEKQKTQKKNNEVSQFDPSENIIIVEL